MAKTAPAEPLPNGARLTVPVLAATGGSGRSTTSGVLAAALAERGDTAVLDQAPRWRSPWPTWLGHRSAGTDPAADGGGLATVPPNEPLTRRQVRAATADTGDGWHLLTDRQPWHAPALDVPFAPGAWYQLAAIGGWQAAVVDTGHSAADDLGRATGGYTPATAQWSTLPSTVPVWCALATGPAVATLMATLTAADRAGARLKGSIVVLVHPAPGRPPAPVAAAATLMATRVHTVAHLPHDARLQSHGPLPGDQLARRTTTAGRALADAVLDAARGGTGWLPPVPQPAPTRP